MASGPAEIPRPHPDAMQKVYIDNLQDGAMLKLDLYSSHGVKLLARGTRLSRPLLERLGRIGRDFFLADDVRSLTRQSILREIDPARILAGAPVPRDVVGLGGRLASEAAEYVEAHLADALALGMFVQVDPEPRRIAAQRRKLADDVVAECARRWESAEFSIETDQAAIDSYESDRQSSPDEQDLIAWRDERVELINAQYARLVAGLSVQSSVLGRLVDELVGMLRRDPQRLAQIALLCPQAFDYLPDHAMSTSVLAVLLSSRLGWTIPGIKLAGLSGLVHDTGMLLIPQRIRVDTAPLSDIDRSRVLKHPALSVSLLEDVRELPDIVRCAAYRHHERDNGHGYPLGLKAPRIGQLPRVLAVADVVSAMLAPRPFHRPSLPHEAIAGLIHCGTDGLLSRPLVRALVESIGLYPIGSHVRLSTGAVAQVIGVRRQAIDRPIVRLLDRYARPTEEVIDLTSIEPWDLSVLDGVEPGDGLAEAGQQRAVAG